MLSSTDIFCAAGLQAVAEVEPGEPEPCVLEGDFEQRHDAAVNTRDQLERLLLAVHAGLDADAVFLCSTASGHPLVLMDVPSGNGWRQRFLLRQLAGRLGLPGRKSGAGALWQPTSGALVARLSRSRQLWLIAVRHAGTFAAGSARTLRLLRRAFFEQRGDRHAHRHLTNSIWGVIRGMNEAIAAKSPFTHGHSERVARMAVRLGEQMGLSTSAQSDLYLAGLLHDVGKIGIRDSVLQKPGKLSDAESTHMREHPVIGDRIVGQIGLFSHLRPGVRNHHERFDGAGYPDRLAGTAIPLLARILAVVDACDAMLSSRPYRCGLDKDSVDALFAGDAGQQWDPAIIAHFMRCRHDLYGIHEHGIGDSVLLAAERIVRSHYAISS